MAVNWTGYHNRQYKKYLQQVKEFKTMAKRASDRMRSLQAMSYGDERFKNVKQFAYRRALQDIQRFWGPDATRWEHKQPTKFNSYDEMLKASSEIRKQMKAMERFLSMETSTRKGIKESFQRRVDTFNKKMGTNFTWEELASFWESKAYDSLARRFMDSKTAFRALYRKLHPVNPKKVKEVASRNVKVQDRVDDQINNFLKESKLTIDDLFKK